MATRVAGSAMGCSQRRLAGRSRHHSLLWPASWAGCALRSSPAYWRPWPLPANLHGYAVEVGEVLSGDEALVDIGAVEPGPADRAPVWVEAEGSVGPVEVPRVGRHRVGEGSAGDELLVHLGAVEPG